MAKDTTQGENERLLRELIHRGNNHLSSIITLVEVLMNLEECERIQRALKKILEGCNDFDAYLRETRGRLQDSARRHST